MKSLGERIKRARLEKNWTQETLSSKAGISKGFLSDLENGKRNVGAENLLDIAGALGLSLDYLMKGDEMAPPPADVYIPAALSDLAADEHLTFKQTLALLQMERQIVAHRTGVRSQEKSDFDWKRFYQSVKEYIS
jgi:transcriptional regulator with XRE-family HTH domain